ncbi:MAG: rhombosortase [Pseudomonadota bacterium]
MLHRQHAWLGVGLLLVLPSLLIAVQPGLARMALAWVPALAWSEPWRWWSAAWVHLSTRHLLANLAGAALVLFVAADTLWAAAGAGAAALRRAVWRLARWCCRGGGGAGAHRAAAPRAGARCAAAGGVVPEGARRAALGAHAGHPAGLGHRGRPARACQRHRLRCAGGARAGQISTLEPSSTTRFVGRLRKSAAAAALRCMLANSFSRHSDMPSPMVGITMSRDRK